MERDHGFVDGPCEVDVELRQGHGARRLGHGHSLRHAAVEIRPVLGDERVLDRDRFVDMLLGLRRQRGNCNHAGEGQRSQSCGEPPVVMPYGDNRGHPFVALTLKVANRYLKWS